MDQLSMVGGGQLSSPPPTLLNAGSQHSFISSVARSREAPASQRLISHQQFSAAVTLNLRGNRSSDTRLKDAGVFQDVTGEGGRTRPWAASALHPASPATATASWVFMRRRRGMGRVGE